MTHAQEHAQFVRLGVDPNLLDLAEDLAEREARALLARGLPYPDAVQQGAESAMEFLRLMGGIPDELMTPIPDEFGPTR
jgi:hypothetical protein